MYSRSLYYLGATLGFFAVVCYVLAFTGILQEPGAPSESPLWRTIGIFLVLGALVCVFFATMQKMFEQAERRHAERRQHEQKHKQDEQKKPPRS